LAVKRLLLHAATLAHGVSGAGAFPMEPVEYVFTEGTASPFNVKYDDVVGSGPYTVATSEDSEATRHNSQRKLARLSDGTLYAIYHKHLAGVYQIYVKQSIDDGVTWTDDTRISTLAGMSTREQNKPSLAVDSNDHLHAVWYGKTGTFFQIWHAEYTDSWQTPVRVSTLVAMDSDHQTFPAIAVDSNDHLHVVWRGETADYGVRQIWYAEYTNAWQPPVRISTFLGMNLYHQHGTPAIAIDSNDHRHVVWHGYATGYTANDQIWYAEYTNAWQTPVRISTSGGMGTYNQTFPCIAIDSNDHRHVVWGGKDAVYSTQNVIWYAEYTNAWQTPIKISTLAAMDNYGQGAPSIAVDSSDNLHVVWWGKAILFADENKVWYNVYTNAWANPVCLQPVGRNQHPNFRWSRWPR